MTRMRSVVLACTLVLLSSAVSLAATPNKTNPFHPITPVAKMAGPIVMNVLFHPGTDKLSVQNPVFYPKKDQLRTINPIYRPGVDHIKIHNL